MVDQEIPILVRLLFGESAPLAMQAPVPRLLCWCQAFEDWLDDRRRRCLATTYQKSITIWKRALRKTGKYPWDIKPADIKAYIAWRQGAGLAPATIKYELSVLSSFYTWCSRRQIDAMNGEIANPADGVQRPPARHYAAAKVLHLEEARALLAVLRMDEAILTRRDYAFFLARLRLGIPHKKLQQLQWGQIETDAAGAWVRAAPNKGRSPLPQDVYRAILDYLTASGRLEAIQAHSYIFAPLADPLRQAATGRAAEWDDSRCLGKGQIGKTLKRYGRLAGIADEKLTLFALRHTATLLRVEAGDSPEAIQEFLHCPQLEVTKNYLKALPPPDTQVEVLRDVEAAPPQLPERKPNRFKPWERMTHGMKATCQPPEEVAAVLAEEIRGMEEEITCLRLLNRGLLEMQKYTHEPAEVGLLTEAYTRSSARLGQMIQIEEEMNKGRPQQDWPDELIASLAEGAWERGEEFDIEVEKNLALGGEDGLAANARRLAEETAGMRVALRRTFQQAIESEQVHRRVYLTEVYSRGCNRLVKLLCSEGDGQTRLKNYLNQMIDDVIIAINEEWGLT